MTKFTVFLSTGQKIVLTSTFTIDQLQQSLKSRLKAFTKGDEDTRFVSVSVSDTDILVLNVDEIQAFMFSDLTQDDKDKKHKEEKKQPVKSTPKKINEKAEPKKKRGRPAKKVEPKTSTEKQLETLKEELTDNGDNKPSGDTTDNSTES